MVDARASKPSVSVQIQCDESPKWQKPQAGWMKLNVDGSFQASDGQGGIGAVLRNVEEVIFAASGFVDRYGSALEAELLACRDGLSLALQWTLLPIVVETDSLMAKQLVQSDSMVRSDMAFLVREVRDLLMGSREVKLCKIHRNQNHLSHLLANLGRSNSLTKFRPDTSCNFISHVAREEAVAE